MLLLMANPEDPEPQRILKFVNKRNMVEVIDAAASELYGLRNKLEEEINQPAPENVFDIWNPKDDD